MPVNATPTKHAMKHACVILIVFSMTRPMPQTRAQRAMTQVTQASSLTQATLDLLNATIRSGHAPTASSAYHSLPTAMVYRNVTTAPMKPISVAAAAAEQLAPHPIL